MKTAMRWAWKVSAKSQKVYSAYIQYSLYTYSNADERPLWNQGGIKAEIIERLLNWEIRVLNLLFLVRNSIYTVLNFLKRSLPGYEFIILISWLLILLLEFPTSICCRNILWIDYLNSLRNRIGYVPTSIKSKSKSLEMTSIIHLKYISQWSMWLKLNLNSGSFSTKLSAAVAAISSIGISRHHWKTRPW